jgi:hypothetical protein
MDRGTEIRPFRQIFDRLATLTAALGLPEQAVSQAETAARLSAEAELPAKPAAALTADILRGAVSDWGQHVSLAITSDFGIRPFQLRAGQFIEAELAQFLEDIVPAPAEATIRVALTLQKDQFLRGQPQVSGRHRVLYLYTDNLKRALGGKYGDVEEIFFPAGTTQCECLLYEDDVAISGQYLTISSVVPDAPAGPQPSEQLKDRLEAIRNLRQENTHWTGFATDLTPLHFVVRKDADPKSIDGPIGRLQYALLVSYLADSVRSTNPDFIAVFSGSSRTEILLPGQRADSTIDASSVLRLFDWCYAERASDKLDIARTVISSVLGADRSKNYDLLRTNAPRVWEAAHSTYLMLVRDLVTKHFDKLKQIQDYVTAISSDVATKVSNIVTTLITSMLAAIGVVLGAFVAYTFDKKISVDVFRLGLRVYGIYILVFPLVLSLLLNNLVDYLILRADFKKRLKDFETVLGLENLKGKIASTVTRRGRHFWFVLSFAVLIYLALAFVCFFKAKVLTLPHNP